MRHVLAGAVFGCLLIGGSVHAQDLFQRTSDEAAVRKMWQDYVAVWNTHDAKALATFLTEDADRLANGSVAKGRAAVQQAFADTDKNATLSSVQVSVRFLTRDVAILDARDEVRRIEKAGVSMFNEPYIDPPAPERKVGDRSDKGVDFARSGCGREMSVARPNL